MKRYTCVETVITNKEFYYMIENEVRKFMPIFETTVCLPAAEKLMSFCGITELELKDYPFEGHYYKSEALKKYFTLIRNLQYNEEIFARIIDCPELKLLQNFTNQDIWGEFKDKESGKICSSNGPFKSPYYKKNPPLARRYDILTITMEDENLFNLSSPRPWTVATIMKGLEKHAKGRVNLVELAYLTKKPECLLCGAETNTLYRDYGNISGCYGNPIEYILKWEVTDEMECLAKKLIKTYNRLIGSKIRIPTIFNYSSFCRNPELPRVSMLGHILETGENYFWTLDKSRYLKELYTTGFITTEDLVAKKG